MDKEMSCCGVLCDECRSYPTECKGCGAIKGVVFWLEHIDAAVCPIYQCCLNDKKLAHCGQCPDLPCRHYNLADPTVSEEESRESRRQQLERLRSR